MKMCSTGYAALSQAFTHWMRLEKMKPKFLSKAVLENI